MLTRVEHECFRRYSHFFIVDTITEFSNISPALCSPLPSPCPHHHPVLHHIIVCAYGLCIYAYMFFGCSLPVLPTLILCCVLRSGWQLGTGETERCLEADLTCPTGASMSGARQQRAAEVGAIAVRWVGVGWGKET